MCNYLLFATDPFVFPETDVSHCSEHSDVDAEDPAESDSSECNGDFCFDKQVWPYCVSMLG